jgi:ATP-dependent helicase/nuclease subunit A
MLLVDAQERQAAIDPVASFLVQAPAGSGKTELLTQRYLRLLALVDQPEHIFAITFTRKAANEMRQRIMAALNKANHPDQSLPLHQQTTHALAQDVLQRNYQCNWRLLSCPERMNILTIDSLCQKINNSIPLFTKHIPEAQISETPEVLYHQAATQCLHSALNDESYKDSIRIILQHFDNSLERVMQLFVDLLAKRDQWLLPLYQAKAQKKTHFELALKLIEDHEIARFKKLIPPDCQQLLFELAKQTAELDCEPNSPRALLKEWEHVDVLTPAIINSLAGLLLTGQNTLRKSFDHHVGIKKSECDLHSYAYIKDESKALLSRLGESSEFLSALLRVRDLPKPHYREEEWDILYALFSLLPLLTAHLNLIFQETGQVDFTEVSQQALSALQSKEGTDLDFYWDLQIRHLLIDEFQDTSIAQFELISHLIKNWQQGDGRTLFLVGDPMQSIYRFRGAEVGLFLRVKEFGIGSIQPKFLELKVNFRSNKVVLDWINNQFQRIFPNQDDIESGAIPFSPSHPNNAEADTSEIITLYCEDKMEQASTIVDCLRDEMQQHPEDTIAILVRSRTQLRELLAIMRQKKIPFQGVDIERLSRLPHLRDVWILTKAMLRPSDRLAWLALLRSPWCGLSLQDLHCIATFNKNQSLLVALEQLDNLSGLSKDGKTRANNLHQVIKNALSKRFQKSLSLWLLETLEQLPHQSQLNDEERADLEPFWDLVDKYEMNGHITNFNLFTSAFEALYSKQSTQSRVQIMTIHKAKGLEFDCVFLPGMGAKNVNRDKPLMRWLKIPSQQQALFLLSPIKSVRESESLLYNYLEKLENQKNYYELQRLLYVAVTRAKQRLYLFDYQDKTYEGTFRSFLTPS